MSTENCWPWLFPSYIGILFSAIIRNPLHLHQDSSGFSRQPRVVLLLNAAKTPTCRKISTPFLGRGALQGLEPLSLSIGYAACAAALGAAAAAAAEMKPHCDAEEVSQFLGFPWGWLCKSSSKCHWNGGICFLEPLEGTRFFFFWILQNANLYGGVEGFSPIMSEYFEGWGW